MSKTFHRRFDTPLQSKVPMTEKFNLVFDSYDDYLLAEFIDARKTAECSTITKAISLGVKVDDFLEAIRLDFLLQVSENRTIGKTAIRNDNEIFLAVEGDNNNTKLKISGGQTQVDQYIEIVEKQFPHNPCFVNWVYDPQYFEKISMPLNTENMPLACMYPFLEGEALASYYDRFLDSSANILILIGKPGTGKTTFIRGMLAHHKKSATLSYNPKVIAQDSFFVDWYSSSDDFMILEDSDTLLMPRAEGNDMMSRFLNLGDGLMSLKNKKLVFSTNLPHIADIDSALTRPGRCFDIIEFDSLNREQASKVAAETNVELPDGNDLTLSEIFASKRNNAKYGSKRKFGFV